MSAVPCDASSQGEPSPTRLLGSVSFGEKNVGSSVHSLVNPDTSNKPHGLSTPYEPSRIVRASQPGNPVLNPKLELPIPGGPGTNALSLPLLYNHQPPIVPSLLALSGS
jgi:hypothetical protein